MITFLGFLVFLGFALAIVIPISWHQGYAARKAEEEDVHSTK